MSLLDEIEEEVEAPRGPRSKVERLMETLDPKDAEDLKNALRRARRGELQYSAIYRVLERRGLNLGDDPQCLSRYARKHLPVEGSDG